jgi:hypothetical protein
LEEYPITFEGMNLFFTTKERARNYISWIRGVDLCVLQINMSDKRDILKLIVQKNIENRIQNIITYDEY